jgi:hypothetical protein
VPAAAVTPAPIAYIKVVAVKKLVVGFLSSAGRLAVYSAGLPLVEGVKALFL